MNELWLFLTFLQIGFFAYGGTYGSMASLEYGILGRNWLSSEQFTALFAANALLPGAFEGNVAAFSGFQAAGMAGLAIALCGLTLPSFVYTAAIVHCRAWFATAQPRKNILPLLRLLAPAFVVAAGYGMASSGAFGSLTEHPWHFGVSAFLCLSTLLGITVFRIRALVMLMLSGIAGIFLF